MATMGLCNRMIRTLKGAAHLCRQAGVTNSPGDRSAVGQLTAFRRPELSRDYLVQLSMVSRSLPRPNEESSLVACQATVETLSTPQEPCDFDVDDSVDSFCQRFRLRACKDKPCTPQVTTRAASYANSRREGGRCGEITDLIRDEFPVLGLGPTAEALLSDRVGFCLAEYGEFLSELDYGLESRSVAIPEFGYKTRVVSCSDPIRIQASESYRVQLFKLLKRLHPCRLPLEDNIQTLRFPKWKSDGPDNRMWFSADLKSATDHLHHSVITAFCDALEVPFELVTGGTIDDCDIRRGTLMGIPCSWPILSLAHCWACVEMGFPIRSFYLKGDDLVSHWTPRQILTYQLGIQRITGMPINFAKSFVSTDSAIFCERWYTARGSVLCQHEQIISVRSLVDRATSDSGLPYNLKVRQRLWSLVGKFNYRKLFRISNDWTGVTPRLGGISYLPVSYGGLEALPDRFGQKAPGLVARVASAVHDCAGDYQRIMGMLRMSWSRAFPEMSPERFAAEWLALEATQFTLRPGADSPEVEAHMSKLMGRYSAWAQLLCPREDFRVRYDRYYKIVRRVRTRCERRLLPQHARLKTWTVQGVRKMVSSLGYLPTKVTFEEQAKAISEMANAASVHLLLSNLK